VKSIRITGIVKMADRVRRELGQPVAPARLASLKKATRSFLAQVNRLLAEHGGTAESLPPPSRRAYRFLAELDFDVIATDQTASHRPPGSVSFRGLRSYVERLLDLLTQSPEGAALVSTGSSLRTTSARIEQHIVREMLDPEHLTAQTRSLRGWLGVFARPEALERYVRAVRTAQRVFDISDRTRFVRPILVHFRPLENLFKVERFGNRTRVWLPTPMIAFTEAEFRELADLMFRQGKTKQMVIEAFTGDACQTVREDLDLLGGLAERTAGVYHDLKASFERVNAEYFGGAMARPKLFWSRGFTGRIFGHYDLVRDAVMVSSTLDRKDVPEFVVDSIVYHELLHKKLGIGWSNGRKAAHTPDFQQQMRRFHRHDEADDLLRKIASRK